MSWLFALTFYWLCKPDNINSISLFVYICYVTLTGITTYNFDRRRCSGDTKHTKLYLPYDSWTWNPIVRYYELRTFYGSRSPSPFKVKYYDGSDEWRFSEIETGSLPLSTAASKKAMMLSLCFVIQRNLR